MTLRSFSTASRNRRAHLGSFTRILASMSPSSPSAPRDRRTFVRDVTAVTGAFVAAPALLLRSRAAHEVIIRGGTVFDGLGARGREADVAIAGGRVALIARRIRETGSLEIDARGLAVAPGFVDIHSHGDGSLWEDPRAESLIRQGITTIVVGQDGSSRAPRQNPQESNRSFAAFGDLWKALDDLKPAVNVASMVGLGTLRGIVIGPDNRPATPTEVEFMRSMVLEALSAGACGASSGLEYTPGAFASLEELTSVCRPLAQFDLPYATHMRNEDDRLLEAIDESIAVARGASCPLQIAHLKTQGPRNWKKIADVFARVRKANLSGMDVWFDRYPYLAYQTNLTNLFPVWSRDGGNEAFLARLDDSTSAPRIRAETLAKVELIGGWDNVQISGVGSAEDRDAEGQRIGAYAERKGREPYVAAVELLKRNRASVGMVGFAMNEENLERILAHPRGMVCSDGGAFAVEGPARRGHPHPRGLGSFPRVLARYVRERKALRLEQAIAKMSSVPAQRVHVDRGSLAVGAAGDVVVFNPQTVEDRATYAEPFAYPVGIKAVLVNGSVALLDGTRTDKHSGTSVRTNRT
jgi:N-acyl-D-amino-acid deacylase